jgi:hypothetical protein
MSSANQSKTQNKPLTAEWPTGTTQMAKTTMGRLIGIGGCGTRRLTSKVINSFPNSKPFLRGDRDTNKFTLSTKGSSAREALQLMAQLVKAEVAWLEGRSSVCPHEHKSINANSWHSKNIIGALIGAKGAGLKRLTEKGGFILYKKSPSGEHSFFIEGLDRAMVTRMEQALKAAAKRIIDAQDEHKPTQATLGSAAGISESDSDSDDEDESKAAPLKKSSGNKGSTGSFDALASSGSDDEGDDGVRCRGYVEYQQAHRQIAAARKVSLDEVTGFEVNEFLDKKAREEDEKMASTMTSDDFPAMNGNKEPISLQVSEPTVWSKKPVSILKQPVPQQLRRTSLVRQTNRGSDSMMGHSSAPTATFPPPPPPPMPAAGMKRQYTMGHTGAYVEQALGKHKTASTALDSDTDDEMPEMSWPVPKSTNWGSDSDDEDDTL